MLFPAGTSADVTARMLADGMSKHLGQRVLVVNRPGAGGAIGYKLRARAEARRLRAGVELQFDLHHLPFRPARVRLPGVRRGGARAGRVGGRGGARDARWKNLNDLVAEAKAKPKAISVGHSGIGSHTHISLAALFSAAGVRGERSALRRGAGGAEPARRPRRRRGAASGRAFGAGEAGPGAPHRGADSEPRPGAARRAHGAEQGVDVSLEAWRGIAVPRGTPRSVDRRARERDPAHGRIGRIPEGQREPRACGRRSCRPRSSAS